MLQVVGHRVLVKVEAISEKFEGTMIVRPENEKHLYQQAKSEGVVVGIGTTAYKNLGDGTPWVAEGDKVVFQKYAGIDLQEADGFYKLLNDEDIQAKRL